MVLRNGPKKCRSYKQLTGLNLVMTKKKRLVMWEAAKIF